jgi:hypothetical protein
MSGYPPVSEHRTFFFFPFCFDLGDPFDPKQLRYPIEDALSAPRLSDLAKAKVKGAPARKRNEDPADAAPIWAMPDAIRERTIESADSGPVWEAEKDNNISVDLHQHIRSLLAAALRNKEKTEQATDPAKSATKVWNITSEARNVLSGGWGTKGGGLEVTLPQSALRRLGLVPDQTLRVRAIIEGGAVYLFRSGIGVQILEVRYAFEPRHSDSVETLLEVTKLLSVSNRQGTSPVTWYLGNSAVGSPGESNPRFSFADFARLPVDLAFSSEHPAFQGSAGDFWSQDSRLFTYTVLKVQGHPQSKADLVEIAYRLATKYTRDGLQEAITWF